MDVILPMKVYIKMSAPQLGDRFEIRETLTIILKRFAELRMKDIYLLIKGFENYS